MLSSFLGLDLGILSDLPLLAWDGSSLLSGFLALVLVFLGLGLILVILIQDPKGGGLASAFGAGPGGDSILGAQATKDISRITMYMSIALAVVIIAMGILDNLSSSQSIGNQGANIGGPTGTATSPEAGDESTSTLPISPVPGTGTPAPGPETGTTPAPAPTPGTGTTPAPAPAPSPETGSAPAPAPSPETGSAPAPAPSPETGTTPAPAPAPETGSTPPAPAGN